MGTSRTLADSAVQGPPRNHRFLLRMAASPDRFQTVWLKQYALRFKRGIHQIANSNSESLPVPMVQVILPRMRRSIRNILAYHLVFPLIMSACSSAKPAAVDASIASSPVAERRPKTITVHGDSRRDDYFWLRDKNDPKVTAYLRAEDSYAETTMKRTSELQNALYTEMVGHIKETDETVPYRRGGYFYYSRTMAGKQYSVYCRKHASLSAPEEVVIDLNDLAKGQEFMALGSFEPSDDGTLLAYSTDNTGYRQYTLHVKNLKTGELLSEQIERVDNVAWASDNKTIFYVTEDGVTKRNDKFFRHVVGTQNTDLLYAEPDELFDIAVGRTRDGAVITLRINSATSTEVRYIPANAPSAPLKIVSSREANHEYDVSHRDDLFYIRTNKGAKNFRVVQAPVSAPSQENWKEVITHRPEVKIEAVDAFADHLVLSEWENGLQQIEVLHFKSRKRQRVAFPEPVYSTRLTDNFVFDTRTLRYTYESLASPPTVFDFDMNSGKSSLIKQTEVPGGFDRKNYTSERVFATASDGVKIPISIVYRTGVRRDGSAPLLLYGYGSYGFSVPPTFSPSRLALLDRGMIYAIAHIRGGGELGEPWREAGRMMKKMTTFSDFIECAEYLIAQKYTSSTRLVIEGRSAGGMLMGAVTNLRPDLFKAVIAQVPFVDVLNTMLDATLPLTTSEYIEWGNPNEKSAYDYMAKYSPYDNVTSQAYPAMLVKVSVNDSQVPYWEGAKLTAKLRALKTDKSPLLLKVNFGAGHGGASGRYDALHETAFNWAFALWQAGISQ
jgi:oligopeptidase B